MDYTNFDVWFKSDYTLTRNINGLFTNYQNQCNGYNEFMRVKRCELLLRAMMSYLYYYRPDNEHTFEQLVRFLTYCRVDENDASGYSAVDAVMDALRKEEPDCKTLQLYDAVRMSHNLPVYALDCICILKGYIGVDVDIEDENENENVLTADNDFVKMLRRMDAELKNKKS